MSELLNYFDRIYVVNLPARADRRRQIERQLASIRLFPTPGRLEFFDAIAPTDTAGFPSIGAHGCFKSHLRILELAEKDNLSSVLVMEDDLAFPEDFASRIGGILTELRSIRWDMVYFGHECEQVVNAPTVTIEPSVGVRCTHFYGVSSAMRRVLIDFLNEVATREPGSPLGGPMHIDGAYSFFRSQHPEFLTVVVSPPMGHQNSSASDISPRWFDRTPLLRQASSALRIVRRYLRQWI